MTGTECLLKKKAAGSTDKILKPNQNTDILEDTKRLLTVDNKATSDKIKFISNATNNGTAATSPQYQTGANNYKAFKSTATDQNKNPFKFNFNTSSIQKTLGTKNPAAGTQHTEQKPNQNTDIVEDTPERIRYRWQQQVEADRRRLKTIKDVNNVPRDLIEDRGFNRAFYITNGYDPSIDAVEYYQRVKDKDPSVDISFKDSGLTFNYDNLRTLPAAPEGSYHAATYSKIPEEYFSVYGPEKAFEVTFGRAPNEYERASLRNYLTGQAERSMNIYNDRDSSILSFLGSGQNPYKGATPAGVDSNTYGSYFSGYNTENQKSLKNYINNLNTAELSIDYLNLAGATLLNNVGGVIPGFEPGSMLLELVRGSSPDEVIASMQEKYGISHARAAALVAAGVGIMGSLASGKALTSMGAKALSSNAVIKTLGNTDDALAGAKALSDAGYVMGPVNTIKNVVSSGAKGLYNTVRHPLNAMKGTAVGTKNVLGKGVSSTVNTVMHPLKTPITAVQNYAKNTIGNYGHRMAQYNTINTLWDTLPSDIQNNPQANLIKEVSDYTFNPFYSSLGLIPAAMVDQISFNDNRYNVDKDTMQQDINNVADKVVNDYNAQGVQIEPDTARSIVVRNTFEDALRGVKESDAYSNATEEQKRQMLMSETENLIRSNFELPKEYLSSSEFTPEERSKMLQTVMLKSLGGDSKLKQWGYAAGYAMGLDGTVINHALKKDPALKGYLMEYAAGTIDDIMEGRSGSGSIPTDAINAVVDNMSDEELDTVFRNFDMINEDNINNLLSSDAENNMSDVSKLFDNDRIKSAAQRQLNRMVQDPATVSKVLPAIFEKVKNGDTKISSSPELMQMAVTAFKQINPEDFAEKATTSEILSIANVAMTPEFRELVSGEESDPEIKEKVEALSKACSEKVTWQEILKNPGSFHTAAAVWFRSKGMDGIAGLASNPWVFYPIILSLILGGTYLVGSLFDGGGTEDGRTENNNSAKNNEIRYSYDNFLY